MAKRYITTPIYYVNDIPHIGHAYTTIAADVLNRYYKLQGDESFLLTGTDEHGAKIAEAAEKAGKDPQEFVDALVPKFKNAWEKLNIGYDQFIRTTDPKHEAIVLEFVKKLQEKGYIEKRNYTGLYCVGCEKFYNKEELTDGKCPDHQTECITHSEENYFFLLTRASKDFDLVKKIKSDEIKVGPEARKNEVLGKIKSGLEDVSISRENVTWGIKFPGDETQTIYVWVDALINYYSATKIYKDGPEWPASLHLMAKDILWFHAIVWPAMLLAIGEKLPKQVYAHGFFTVSGQKMSKSIGNVLDPVALAEKYGTDAVRYAILREFPFGEDGDISEEKIAARYKTDLGNALGNLLQRTLSMINKYDVKISDSVKTEDFDKKYSTLMEALSFSEILTGIWNLYIKPSNQLIDDEKPWELAGKDDEKLKSVLTKSYSNLKAAAGYLEPFMPETTEKIRKQLDTFTPEPLFPRLENETL